MNEEHAVHHIYPKKRRRLAALKIIGLSVLIVGAAAAGTAYYQSAKELNRLRNSPAVSADQEVKDLVAKVGAHMALPSEKPTIATVEDTQKLAGQAFFKHARNGDKVLMYAESKKAILYRPATDKIMEVAYLNIQEKTAETDGAAGP